MLNVLRIIKHTNYMYLLTGISKSAMYFKQKLMKVLSFSSPIKVLMFFKQHINTMLVPD